MCPLKRKSKTLFAFCAGWAGAFKRMGLHIGVWGAWNEIQRGAGCNDASALWWTRWTKVAWYTAGRWTWPTPCECWGPWVTVFYQRSPLFYRHVCDCCSCDVIGIFLNVYTRQDVLLLLSGSERRSTKLLLLLFTPSRLSEVWKTQMLIWIWVWFPLTCTCKYVTAQHFCCIFLSMKSRIF